MTCYVQTMFMFVLAAVMAANEPSNNFEKNINIEKNLQCSFCADSAPSQSLGLQSLGFRYAESWGGGTLYITAPSA